MKESIYLIINKSKNSKRYMYKNCIILNILCIGKQQASMKTSKKNQDEHVRLNVRKTLKEVLTTRCKESQTAINLEVRWKNIITTLYHYYQFFVFIYCLSCFLRFSIWSFSRHFMSFLEFIILVVVRRQIKQTNLIILCLN